MFFISINYFFKRISIVSSTRSGGVLFKRFMSSDNEYFEIYLKEVESLIIELLKTTSYGPSKKPRDRLFARFGEYNCRVYNKLHKVSQRNGRIWEIVVENFKD